MYHSCYQVVSSLAVVLLVVAVAKVVKEVLVAVVCYVAVWFLA